MSTFFSNNSYEMQNAWSRTDAPVQKLSKSQLSSIKQAVVRDKELEDGTIIKNVVFMITGQKPRSMKLSPYNEQFKAGTKIDPKSVEISEFTNEDGELKYTITCEEA